MRVMLCFALQQEGSAALLPGQGEEMVPDDPEKASPGPVWGATSVSRQKQTYLSKDSEGF